VNRQLGLHILGQENADQFTRVRAKESKLIEDVNRIPSRVLFGFRMISSNAKTSISLDFPIGHTCRPTKLCADVCYASGPRAPTLWRKSLNKRLRNRRIVLEFPPEVVASKLEREFRRLQLAWRRRRVKLDFLRINGTGDLFPELIHVLNRFIMSCPDVRLWIVSRQVPLAERILVRPNVFLQLSVDRTTKAHDLQATRDLVANNPRAYMSFLRTRHDDDTLGAAIVFNEKLNRLLPFQGVTDCPVDAGVLGLGNIRGQGGTACATCRKCFTDPVLFRQRGLKPVPVPPLPENGDPVFSLATDAYRWAMGTWEGAARLQSANNVEYAGTCDGPAGEQFNLWKIDGHYYGQIIDGSLV
jgi:hypothetical protein